MRKFVLFFTVCTLIINVVNAQSEMSEEDIIRTLFNDTYHQKTRPVDSVYKQGPVEVSVNMYLRSVENIDDNKHEFDVQLTFREQWRDERLIYNTGIQGGRKYINLMNPSSLTWLPDSFFSNEKEGSYHNLMARNEYFRVHPDGEILYSTRISLKLSCPMSFRYFPFDEQICSIRIASWGYTTTDLIYKWKNVNPVQVSSYLHMGATFSLTQFTTDYCDSTTNTGTYSCLRVDFLFKREFYSYLIKVYIPCIMMVIVAYLSFWIDSRALLARIGLAAGTLFLSTTLIIGLSKTFPTTSYTKAVDIWTGACLTFMFAALVEIIVVQHLEKRESDKKSDTIEKSVGNEQEVKLNDRKENSEKTCISKFCNDDDSLSKKIDRVSRLAFPATFVMFVIIYSLYYSF